MDDLDYDRSLFAIKYNNTQVAEPCAICDQPVDQPAGPALFAADSWKQVCANCGAKFAPELSAMLTWQQSQTTDYGGAPEGFDENLPPKPKITPSA